jgi:alpha-tubulin suppressor-like RCC1 family protein
MTCRRATFFTAAAVLWALSCQPAKDSFVVLHSDVNCDVPRVYQLRITVSHPGSAEDQKTIPPVASSELGFPNTIVLVLPPAISGSITLDVEALDNKLVEVGYGAVSGQIDVGGRIDLNVTLAVVAGTTTPTETVDGGGFEDADAGAASPADLAVGSGVSFVQVAVGRADTCAIRSDSSLWCWGDNADGELLLSDTSNRLTPVAVAGAAWSQVACGSSHTCAVSNQATLSCWGNNGSGQLGATTLSASGGQTTVPGGPWQRVVAGIYQTCAIAQDTSLWCWGANTNGELGTGDTVSSGVPVQVAGQGWSQVSGNYLHSCAVKNDGTLWCWGLNANLQTGTSSLFPWSPTQVGSETDWSQVTTGLYHSCAVKTDGTLWCWGGNLSGQLGSDSIAVLPTAQTSDPVQVTGTTWKSVSAGQSHTCAVTVDGTLWCWGDNSEGQLGDGTEDSESTPVAVGSGQTWTMVAAGISHTCALDTGGSLWCWGDNSAGQLGIGSNDPRQVPTRVVQ